MLSLFAMVLPRSFRTLRLWCWSGNEVIVPAFTFVATINPVFFLKAAPVLLIGTYWIFEIRFWIIL